MANIEGHRVRLIDDGTLDTVLSVDGCQHRYSQDFAEEFRDPCDGHMTEDGFFALAETAIDEHRRACAQEAR